MFKKWMAIALWKRVLAGILLGVLAGAAVGEASAVWFKPIGDVYIALIRMVVVPLLFTSIVVSVASLRNVANATRLGGRTLAWYVTTAALAALVGIGTAVLLQPGETVGALALGEYKAREIPGLVEVLVGIVPSNPFQAFVQGNVLQILFFAVVVGGVLASMGEAGARLQGVIEDANALVMRIVRIVLQLTPIGSFGLIAWVVGVYGLEKLAPLGDFIIAMYIACAVQVVLVYGGLARAHGLGFRRFFANVWPVFQTGFVTSSSFATLPVTQETMVRRLGVPKDYAAFAAPLGASMKMDACGAIYPAIASIFIAQYLNIDLDMTAYVAIFLTATLGTLATAGVPGPAIISITMTLNAVGLPLEAIGYIIAVDRVIDMMRTATNTTGQATVPLLVAAEEGLLDRAVYDGVARDTAEVRVGAPIRKAA
jgi:Na+/H+-dicarboxylate symporter